MADFTIRGIIEILLGKTEADQATEELKKLGDQASTTGEQVHKGAEATHEGAKSSAETVPIVTALKDALFEIGTAIAGLFALREVFNFLRDSFSEAAVIERRLGAISFQLNALGLD